MHSVFLSVSILKYYPQCHCQALLQLGMFITFKQNVLVQEYLCFFLIFKPILKYLQSNIYNLLLPRELYADADGYRRWYASKLTGTHTHINPKVYLMFN
jgi:hypothetical protein